jgi:tyrosyl-tRNA synthetase
MSIPDELLPEWIGLVPGAPGRERAEWIGRARERPLEAKRWLAEEVAARYHGREAAVAAREAFDRVHREREVPAELETVALKAEPDGTLWIAYVLQRSGLSGSTSEARRLVEQGGVRVDGETVADPGCHLPPGSYVVQRGKRTFLRVRVEASPGADS